MKRHIIRSFAALGIIAGVISLGATSVISAAETPDAALRAAVADKGRTPASVARDVYRHPAETLAFWGLKPGLKVVEIEPGGGYWTEILAAYAKTTGGQYGATLPDVSGPKFPDAARKYVADLKARYATDRYVAVNWITWSEEVNGPLGPPGSADMVITARNIHDWMWEPGQLDKALHDFNMVLKPGGILAVEDHRADPRPQAPDAHDGYVNTKVLVAAVEKAGFKLEASSEVNANPKDTKNYPFGVWSLPPTNAKAVPSFMKTWPGRPADAALDPVKAKEIGESDRMTLRFRKL